MAKAHIVEYGDLAKSGEGEVIPVGGRTLATQAVTYSTSTQSTAFKSQTRFIRLICDAKAHFAFGDDPAATADSPYIVADTAEYFGVDPNRKIALYDGSS